MTRPGHARRGRAGGERGVQADAGHGHPETVRADQPHAVPAAHREQVGAGGDFQPGGDHHQGPHAALTAPLGHVEHSRGAHRDHRQVDRLGQVERGGQAPLAADLPGARVHRVEPAGVPAGPDVVHDGAAHGSPPPAGADHRNRLGREHVPQAGDLGAALPVGHCVQVAVQRGAGVLAGQGERQLEDPVGVVALDRQAGGGEYVEHGLVLRQGLRGEGGYLVAPGERDQMLEQQGGDAPVVHMVGHRERDLGLPLGLRDVAGDADHFAVRDGQQGHLAGGRVPADPPGLDLGRMPAYVEEPHVAVVAGHRLVHGLDRVEIARASRADLDRRPVG